jgi:hypothetical protein
VATDDQYGVRFYDVLVRALRISYVTQTHDPCSYKLEPLVSSDDTESNFCTLASDIKCCPLQYFNEFVIVFSSTLLSHTSMSTVMEVT